MKMKGGEVRVINISGELERQSGYLLASTGCTVTNEYRLGRSFVFHSV
jgi:hypothetical protein